ncbi:hypothetical protein CYY_010104 [Polysphondylium violaceum]|uniref:Uncharacterized protein n=1 Tax=Polysphondylium violaceum TaxID=133409 RepID=A0A8J4PL54_9MYCE|nr:hypothetical protein CYY_010104 [Polysphondylium violaceum]
MGIYVILGEDGLMPEYIGSTSQLTEKGYSSRIKNISHDDRRDLYKSFCKFDLKNNPPRYYAWLIEQIMLSSFVYKHNSKVNYDFNTVDESSDQFFLYVEYLMYNYDNYLKEMHSEMKKLSFDSDPNEQFTESQPETPVEPETPVVPETPPRNKNINNDNDSDADENVSIDKKPESPTKGHNPLTISPKKNGGASKKNTPKSKKILLRKQS